MSAVTTSTEHPTRAGDAALAVGGAAILAWSFRDTVVELVGRWSTDPNYSHGFLVPVVSLLIYRAAGPSSGSIASDLRTVVGRIAGVLLIVGGLVLHCFTVLLPSTFLGSTALLLVVVGLARFLCEPATWRRLRAPLAFLMFLIPWPAAFYSRVAFPLRQFSSAVAEVLLDACGVAVARSGNLLQLPGQNLFVAETCSGLRQLVAFLAVGAAVAFLAQRPVGFRIAVFLSAIPLAVAMNIARITLMGLMVSAGRADWTTGSAHDLEGLVMVCGGLAGLWLEVRLFDAIQGAPTRAPEVRGVPLLQGGMSLG